MGQQGLGAEGVGQLSRRVTDQQLHEGAMGAPSSVSPLGLCVICGDASITSC